MIIESYFSSLTSSFCLYLECCFSASFLLDQVLYPHYYLKYQPSFLSLVPHIIHAPFSNTCPGFPKYYIFIRGTALPVRGGGGLGEVMSKLYGGTDSGGRDKSFVWREFVLQKPNICKVRFCMFNTYFS